MRSCVFWCWLRECVRTALRPSHVVSLFLFSQEENAVRVVWVNFAVRVILRLVAVVLGLEGSLLWKTKVVALLLGELGEVDVEGAKVGEGDLLVQLLGEHVHAQGVVLGVVPQLELGQNLRTKNQNGVNFLEILDDPKID